MDLHVTHRMVVKGALWARTTTLPGIADARAALKEIEDCRRDRRTLVLHGPRGEVRIAPGAIVRAWVD
jgi:hypothetical protein